MISIPLYNAGNHPCSYLPEQLAGTTYVHPSFSMSTEIYAELLALGYRRSGDEVYKPNCAACSACIPARVPVAEFKPNRAQQRCLSRNAHTTASIKPAHFDAQHYALYLRYQKSKHPDGDMQYTTEADYLRFLSSSWCDTLFVEFAQAGQVVAVSVIDRFNSALSAVYTFFDPDFSRFSLGVYAVLWQIQASQHLGLDWVYLGYWIADCQKMRYKCQYQPLEVYQNGDWQRQARRD